MPTDDDLTQPFHVMVATRCKFATQTMSQSCIRESSWQGIAVDLDICVFFVCLRMWQQAANVNVITGIHSFISIFIPTYSGPKPHSR